jgi:hypothetical protein
LCKSVGGNNIKMMTITDNVGLALNYYDMLSFHQKKDIRNRQILKWEVDQLKKSELDKKVSELLREQDDRKKK